VKIKVKLNNKGLVEDIEKQEVDSDWITDKKLPVLPDIFLPVVSNYTIGSPISKDIRVSPISGQQWSNLTHNERGKLLELVEWLGESAEEYCRKWQSLLPRDPR